MFEAPPRLSRLGLRAAFAVACVALLAGLGLAAISGSFSTKATNAGNTFAAAPDMEAPTVLRSVFEKFQGGVPGYVGASGRHYAYAALVDGGNPSSGINFAEALLSSPPSSRMLMPGSWTVGGDSYNYRSAEATSSDFTSGRNDYEVYADDNANNARTGNWFSFQYDPVAPLPGNVTLANGGVEGVPDAGDTITYVIDSSVDPSSLIGDWEAQPDERFPVSWDGSSRPVTVRFLSPVAYGSAHPDRDPVRVTVHDGAGPELGVLLNLGTLSLHSEAWGVDCEARFVGSTVATADDDSRVVVTLGTADPGEILTSYPLAPETCP